MRIKNKAMNFAMSSVGSQHRQQRTRCAQSCSYCCRELYKLDSPKGHCSLVIQTEGDKSLATQGQDVKCQDRAEYSSQMGMTESSASACSVCDRGLWDLSENTAWTDRLWLFAICKGRHRGTINYSKCRLLPASIISIFLGFSLHNLFFIHRVHRV